MYGLPFNMKSYSYKTWQTPLLFLKSLQIQNLKRKKCWGHGILCPPRLKKWGRHVPRVPHQIAPMRKAITRLNVLRKLRLSVPRYALLILYRSYILPFLDYGDVICDNISTADSCRLEKVQTTAAKLILGCMQTTSNLKILNELSMSPLHLRRNCHILFAFHKILLGPCPIFLATLTPKLFHDLSNHSLRHVMNVQPPSCRTALFHSSFFLKASWLWTSLPTSVQSLGPNLFPSKVTVLICGKSHQVLHLCGVNLRVTSWLCMLCLSHSPLNPECKHYRLCSCGLSQTETYILLECDLTRAPL